jgi:hypothetical protein
MATPTHLYGDIYITTAASESRLEEVRGWMVKMSMWGKFR